jgi:hypothetical protein
MISQKQIWATQKKDATRQHCDAHHVTAYRVHRKLDVVIQNIKKHLYEPFKTKVD